MVKSCQENNQAQYVQYVYDIQGNKVRQFTGMTSPLTLTVSEVADAVEGADTFSYAGKTYQLTVSGTKKTDTLNTDTKEDSVVIYKNDKNGNQLATVNRYEIPSEKKDSTYIDIDVTLGDNRLNENVVNHYNAENQLIQTLT